MIKLGIISIIISLFVDANWFGWFWWIGIVLVIGGAWRIVIRNGL